MSAGVSLDSRNRSAAAVRREPVTPDRRLAGFAHRLLPVDFRRHLGRELRFSPVRVQPVDLLLHVVQLSIAESGHLRVGEQHLGRRSVPGQELLLTLRAE